LELKSAIYFLLIISFTLFNANALGKKPDSEVLRYRYNIAENTSDLFTIRKKFGKILKSGDITYSFNASKEVVDRLDEIGRELDNIHVPEKMIYPYNVFLESVKAYRKSATCIRNATEIMLGYFDGSEKDVNQLIELSGDYADTANMYLDLSIAIHKKLFNQENIEPEVKDKKNNKQNTRNPSTKPDSYISEKVSI